MERQCEAKRNENDGSIDSTPVAMARWALHPAGIGFVVVVVIILAVNLIS